MIGFPPIRKFDSDRSEELLRRTGQNFHDIQTVLASRIDDRAHDGEVFRAQQSPEAPRDLHPQLHHSKRALRRIVRERDGKVVQEEERSLHLLQQSPGEIVPGSPLLSPAFPFLPRVAFRKLFAMPQRLIQDPFVFMGCSVQGRLRDLDAFRARIAGRALRQQQDIAISSDHRSPSWDCCETRRASVISIKSGLIASS